MMEYYYHKGSFNSNVVDVDVDDNNGCKIMAAINWETPKLGFTYPNGFNVQALVVVVVVSHYISTRSLSSPKRIHLQIYQLDYH